MPVFLWGRSLDCWNVARSHETLPKGCEHYPIDIRPREPFTDFDITAGDTPNTLTLTEHEKRRGIDGPQHSADKAPQDFSDLSCTAP